jgi:GNAT superfamily N-acetyltransferase
MMPEINNHFLVNLIRENHFGLYKKIAELPSIKSFQGEDYSYIMTEKAEWPNMIYDLRITNENTAEVLKKISDENELKSYRSYLIIDSISKTIDFDKLARQFSFMPIMRWPGMVHILSESDIYKDAEKSITIKMVNSSKEMSDWINISNRTLFTHQGITVDVFLPVLDSGIKLYLAYYKDIPAATLLIYNKKETTGIYVASTLPEYRGKGIMSKLISYVNSIAYDCKLKYSILEANANSHKLYTSLGYKTVCNFDIFLKMQK